MSEQDWNEIEIFINLKTDYELEQWFGGELCL